MVAQNCRQSGQSFHSSSSNSQLSFPFNYLVTSHIALWSLFECIFQAITLLLFCDDKLNTTSEFWFAWLHPVFTCFHVVHLNLGKQSSLFQQTDYNITMKADQTDRVVDMFSEEEEVKNDATDLTVAKSLKRQVHWGCGAPSGP